MTAAEILLMLDGRRIQESSTIERENAERGPNNPDRLTIQELDRDVGHAHALPGKPREAVACRVLEHGGGVPFVQRVPVSPQHSPYISRLRPSSHRDLPLLATH